MNNEFEITLKRRNTRERFNSSMTHQEYCSIYGPPKPLIKPLEDPADEMPLFDLETKVQETQDLENGANEIEDVFKMDTILEIDGSQNYTQNLQRSPRVDFWASNKKPSTLFTLKEEDEEDNFKRTRVRMRSQSDSSEYLIFNFLDRANQNGRKKIKLE